MIFRPNQWLCTRRRQTIGVLVLLVVFLLALVLTYMLLDWLTTPASELSTAWRQQLLGY